MREVIHKETPLRWFNGHPIVSTVLWILGHDMSKQQKRIESDETKSPSLLSWKDDHGGHIAEYIQEVQGKTSSVTDTTYEGRADNGGSEIIKLKRNEGTSDRNEPPSILGDAPNGELSAECTPSPQWGFYVPITPPDQEKFTKNGQKKEAEDIKIRTPKTS